MYSSLQPAPIAITNGDIFARDVFVNMSDTSVGSYCTTHVASWRSERTHWRKDASGVHSPDTFAHVLSSVYSSPLCSSCVSVRQRRRHYRLHAIGLHDTIQPLTSIQPSGLRPRSILIKPRKLHRLMYIKLEGTHTVRTHAVLLLTLTLTLTFDLSTPNHTTCIGYLKVIPYTKFEHFGIIRF